MPDGGGGDEEEEARRRRGGEGAVLLGEKEDRDNNVVVVVVVEGLRAAAAAGGWPRVGEYADLGRTTGGGHVENARQQNGVATPPSSDDTPNIAIIVASDIR